ncbi:hypothetical protein ACIA8E_38060 [Streptomyces sp. NPDC051664]|uniref:hypothetical protein n=1 Tax=Streptomyces sp. NPDC051664 TaxID=3365668 RepID=UPI00378B79E5
MGAIGFAAVLAACIVPIGIRWASPFSLGQAGLARRSTAVELLAKGYRPAATSYM